MAGKLDYEAVMVGVIDRMMRGLRTIIPGKVGPVTREANGERDADFELGVGKRQGGQESADGIAPDAPVMTLAGGGFAFYIPLTAGDEALAVVSDRPVGRWRQNKTPGQAPAFSEHHHDPSDALVLPFAITSPNGTVASGANLAISGPEGAAFELEPGGALTLTKQGVTVATIELDDAGAITLTPAAGQTVKLGGSDATLGVARLTDTVGPTVAMTAWALMIETAITGAGGVIPPGTNFASIAALSFADITGASTTTLSK